MKQMKQTNNNKRIMKKYIIIAAAAIVAMAACSKVETNDAPDVKVTFQAANYVPQTKASSVFTDFPDFQCRAFLHAEGVDVDENGDVITTGTGKPSYQEFFSSAGETISPYDSENHIISVTPSASAATSVTNVNYWAPSHEYYWPKGAESYVNFAGWYATAGIEPDIDYSYNTTDSKWVATMTWEYTASTGSASANILYSKMAWRYNDNPAASYKYNGLASTYKGVPMLFKHALAQINVKAYASGDNLTAGTDEITEGSLCTRVITLENVKITPVLLAGELVLTNEDPESPTTPQDWDGDWAAKGSATATDLEAGNKIVDQVLKANAEDVFAATCVIPQDLTDVVLSFDVRIVTTYTTGGARHEELLHKEISLSAASTATPAGFGTEEWEMNHKYTYYLSILPAQNEVRFDPALDAVWVETEAGPVSY